MRIEKISGDKIKVTLSASDLINFDIDINELTPDSEELHSFLFHIMETIRIETGFNPYSGQVVVEATPSREGISIVVSKLKTNAGKMMTRSDLKRNVAVRAKKKISGGEKIFYFDDFDDLCDALCLLTDEELTFGALYKLSDTFCFIVNNSSRFKRCVSLMTEFSAQQSKYPMQLMYIKEHGKIVAEGETLISMAKKLRQLT